MRFKLYSIPKHHLIIIKNKLKICIILHVDTNKIAGHEDAIRSIQEMVAQANITVDSYCNIKASNSTWQN